MSDSPLNMAEWFERAGLDVCPPPGLAQTEVRGMALDSRQVQAGDVFVALRGASSHGLEHASQAAQRGAVAVLSDERPLNAISLPQLTVPGLARSVGRLASVAYGDPSQRLDVLGVTGTNGKTSTVQFLDQSLTALGHRVATQGTLGSGFAGALEHAERTTPDAAVTQRWLAAMASAGADLVAMEVSSHALVQGRVDGVRFRLALYTNLSRDHLDYHRDMDDYFAAKARLFNWPALGAAIVNLDDAYGRQLQQRLPAGLRCIGYAIDRPAELRAESVQANEQGLRFELVHAGARASVALPLLGRFNLSNALGVAGALLALGHDLPRVATALAALRPVRGRMERVARAQGAAVVVDYAHTPDALTQALASLRPHVRGRLWLVFGCGGERDPGKRPLMAAAAELGADRIIVSDDNPRGEDGDAIVAQIMAGFSAEAQVEVERDRAKAIGIALTQAGADDLVLIAGKGHENFQHIGAERRPFDDAEVARGWAEPASC
jgi:UDP-N-acetylmuramoyl-L-alanyl-D-glutamate--2,6-diaminopimelate ligase